MQSLLSDFLSCWRLLKFCGLISQTNQFTFNRLNKWLLLFAKWLSSSTFLELRLVQCSSRLEHIDPHAGYVCNPSQTGQTVTDFDRNLISQISLRFFNRSLPHIADVHNLCGTTFYGGNRIRPKFGRTHKCRNKIQQLISHLIRQAKECD